MLEGLCVDAAAPRRTRPRGVLAILTGGNTERALEGAGERLLGIVLANKGELDEFYRAVGIDQSCGCDRQPAPSQVAAERLPGKHAKQT